MRKSKPNSSKKLKHGVDFKKIKRKVGRKLLPPKNFTDTSIKSKAITLPEQSVVSDKIGLAVNRKGLTLRELLQQTSHHNTRIRKAALAGIKDLVWKHPLELKIHKVTIIEKLRERICDNDKMVRETLYQLLKTVVFPGLKEDITRHIISLLMAYVFNAMTHMIVDIRLMAFKFFELIVLNYPSSFTLYSAQVLDNYIDVLRNNQIYLQDKSNLKNALGGLSRCLSLLACESGGGDRIIELDSVENSCLQAYTGEPHKDDAVIFLATKKFEDLVPVLINCFQESISMIRAMSVIDATLFDCSICTLQCVNLSVKLFFDVVNKFHSRSMPLVSMRDGGPDLVRSDMLQLLKKLWEAFPIVQIHRATSKDGERFLILNVEIAETFLNLFEWIDDSSLMIERFLRFIETFLLGEVDSGFPPNRALLEKKLCGILPFIRRLIQQVNGSWRLHLLKAFTVAFKDHKVDSQIILLYLSAMEDMLLPTSSCGMLLSSHLEMRCFQIEWLQELPRLLCCNGDKHSNVSKVILKLLLRIGQSCMPNSPLALEYDHLQSQLKEFYSTRGYEDTVIYGPFIKLPTDCQELAISSLYYFSSLSVELLESLASCCISPAMDACMVIRTIEVLHSAYRAGHVNISCQIGFLFTLIARSKVSPTWFSVAVKDVSFTDREDFWSVTSYVCSCLSEMGDNSLVLKLLFKAIYREILMKPSLDNSHGLLKLIFTLDTRPSVLSDENACCLSNWLAGYLIDAATYIQEVHADVQSDQYRIFKYYIQPCVILFCRNDKLLFHVMEMFVSFIIHGSISVQTHSSVNYSHDLSARVHAVSSILFLMYNEVKVHKSLYSSKDVIQQILQNMENILDSNKFTTTFEEKHRLQDISDQLKSKFNV